MDKPKLTLKKASTAFGYAVLEALEKGKGSTSTIGPDKIKEIQSTSIATSHLDAILKAAFREDEIKKETLTKKRERKSGKKKEAKAKTPKPTELERLQNQNSLLAKSNTELKKQISSIYNSSSVHNRENLMTRALDEINKLNARNSILERENKALRNLALENMSKSFKSSGEIVFYGGQYSNPET